LNSVTDQARDLRWKSSVPLRTTDEQDFINIEMGALAHSRKRRGITIEFQGDSGRPFDLRAVGILRASSCPVASVDFRHRDSAWANPLKRRSTILRARLETIEGEARREQMARLAAEPDLGPLIRTLLRLRHHLVMIGRAAVAPFPDWFQKRLASSLESVAEAAADYMHKSAAALVAC
jgi:hypothetical protein